MPRNRTAEQKELLRKWKRILRAFLEGAELTRFDAEKIGDHSLNSTVSNLRAKGIQISREPVTIEGRYGVIHCKRYRLPANQRPYARRLLALQRIGSASRSL